MTANKLFREDSYLTNCESKIVKKEGNKIWLDQTIFFAFSGGQQSDSGTVNNIPVLEAEVQDDKDIAYTLEDAFSLNAGDTVIVQVDSEKRDRIRRLHSSVHLLWFVFKDMKGEQKEIGSNVTDQKGRLDFEYPESVAELVSEIEEKMNKLTSEDHMIERFPSDEDPYRWVWKMGGWKMPCGGTHVKNTQEIGPVKVKRKNIGAGKERFEVTLAE